MATPPDPADDAGFLSRWARRKAQARSGQPLAEPAPSEPVTPAVTRAVAIPAAAGVMPAGAAAPLVATETTPAAVDPAPPAPTLDDVAALTHESSFARFVQQGVAAPVRNAALKKLFSDPHFNVMDGLDIYIDDYGLPDPLSPELLAQMNGNHFLGFTPAGEPEAVEAGIAAADAVHEPAPDTLAKIDSFNDTNSVNVNVTDADTLPVTDGAPPPHSEPKPTDEDPDLRLQPDPAPGRTGAAPGPGQDPGGEHRGA